MVYFNLGIIQAMPAFEIFPITADSCPLTTLILTRTPVPYPGENKQYQKTVIL